MGFFLPFVGLRNVENLEEAQAKSMPVVSVFSSRCKKRQDIQSIRVFQTSQCLGHADPYLTQVTHIIIFHYVPAEASTCDECN